VTFLRAIPVFGPALFATGLCACVSSEARDERAALAGATPPDAPVATQRVRTDHFTVSVHGTRRCATPPHLAPEDGWMRLGIDLEVTATSAAQVPTNPYHALLVDADGGVHEASLNGCDPALPVRLLQRGESARGWLSFDVPSGAGALTFSYAPRIHDEAVEVLLTLQ
jgi:hypothetical protein